MSNWENDYLNLVEQVISTGFQSKSRAGDTYSLPGESIKIPLDQGFPLLTTRKMFPAGVQFGHAVQMQGRRMVLKGQAAEYDGRNVAAIDRQARVARQGGLVVVGSATNAPLFVGFPRVGAVGVCLCFFCHIIYLFHC